MVPVPGCELTGLFAEALDRGALHVMVMDSRVEGLRSLKMTTPDVSLEDGCSRVLLGSAPKQG